MRMNEKFWKLIVFPNISKIICGYGYKFNTIYISRAVSVINLTIKIYFIFISHTLDILNLSRRNDFEYNNYWSSSEESSTNTYNMNFNNGNTNSNNKTNSNRVRSIRLYINGFYKSSSWSF